MAGYYGKWSLAPGGGRVVCALSQSAVLWRCWAADDGPNLVDLGP
jgi:hypothetical protein